MEVTAAPLTFDLSEIAGPPKRNHPFSHAFLQLPTCAVDEIGFFTARGERMVKFHLAVLSGLAWYAQRSTEREVVILPQCGTEMTIPANEFWISRQRIAANLFVRIFRERPKGAEFSRFYRRLRKVFDQLVNAGWLARVPHPDLSRSRGRQGSLWTFQETKLGAWIGDLPPSSSSCVRLTKAPLSVFTAGDMVDAVEHTASLLAGESGLISEHSISDYVVEIDQVRKPRPWLSGMRKVAETDYCRSIHRSIGAYRQGQETDDSASVAMPYVVYDIDVHEPHDKACRDKAYIDPDRLQEAFKCARFVLDAYCARGCRLEDVVCSFSGWRGFHVSIPSGAFGNPVFFERDLVKPVFERVSREVLGDEYEHLTALGRLDTSTFHPRHLIRVPNSYRRETKLYSQAFTGTDFAQLTVYDVIERSRCFRHFELKNPRRRPVVSELATLLTQAAREVGLESIGPSATTADLTDPATWPEHIRRTLKGCCEGESWWISQRGRTSVGRNYSIHSLARFLYEQGASDQQVLDYTSVANEANRPPLSSKEVQTSVRSAEKRTRKQQQRGQDRRSW